MASNYQDLAKQRADTNKPCHHPREAIVRKIKDFFVKSLHEMETPSPFYELPLYSFSFHFFSEKKDDFEGCLKKIDIIYINDERWLS